MSLAWKEFGLPQPPRTRADHTQANEQAAQAARWMHEEMGRNQGELTQDDAWKGVRERFGDACAIKSDTDCWLSKAVLSAFRKLTPETVWDPTGRRWRQQRRNDAVNDGGRMLAAPGKRQS